jgi:hypothetical protein
MPVAIRTYNDGKYIYSVDMMLAYLNIKGHPVEKLFIEELVPQLEQNVWGDFSPMTVIKKMDTAKYSENSERIKKADTSYPIIVTGKQTNQTRTHSIVDGYHRLAKLLIDGKSTVNVHVFDSALMKKFILNKDLDFVKVHQHTHINEILELWAKRFCQ